MRFWIKSWSKKRSFFSSTGNWVSVSQLERRGCSPLYHRANYVSSISFAYRFSAKFPKVFSNELLNQKKSVFLSSPGNSNRSLACCAWILITILPRNYMFGVLCGPSFTKCVFSNKILKLKRVYSSPRRGIEFRSPAWQVRILITILPRNSMLRFLCRPSFTKCGFEQNPEVKKIILLLDRELSFVLQRERRGCSPLYYRGTALVYRLRTIFHQVSRGISKSNAEPKKVYSSPRRGIEPVSRVMGVDTDHYTTVCELHV